MLYGLIGGTHTMQSLLLRCLFTNLISRANARAADPPVLRMHTYVCVMLSSLAYADCLKCLQLFSCLHCRVKDKAGCNSSFVWSSHVKLLR